MATKTVRCACGVKLAVSFQAQRVTCPVCRIVTYLRPANGRPVFPPANHYNNPPVKSRPVIPPVNYYNNQPVNNRPVIPPANYYNNQPVNNRPVISPANYYSNQPVSNRPVIPPANYYNNQPAKGRPVVPPANYYNNNGPVVADENQYNNQPASGGPVIPAADLYNDSGYYPAPVQAHAYYQERSLITHEVSPLSVHGSKRALLCGVSYRGHNKYMKGTINDVNAMKYFLIQRMGFPHQSICVLTEDEHDLKRIPTKRNIREAMRWLVEGCQSGDSLVFHYSGHAAKVRDMDGDEIDGFDESLCPLDYDTEGMILDDEINATIVRPIPRGAKLHAIIDTCFSGTVLDLPFMCKMNGQGYFKWDDQRISNIYKGTMGGLAICLSACDDHQNSVDTKAYQGAFAPGAMTYGFIHAVETEPRLTYGRLLSAIRYKVYEAQTSVASPVLQEPQLTSSEKFDIHSVTFTL